MLSVIQHNPYLTLLIATTIEWPIATFVSAGLAAHHVLRIEYVIMITIIGDVLGDAALYIIGRYFHKLWPVHRIVQKLPNKQQLHELFDRRPLVYIIIGKFTPYLATPTLIFAGMHHMNPVRFMRYSLIISTLVKIVYITLWYLGAVSVQQVQWFLHWRSMIAGYLIVWGLCFWWAGVLYRYLGAFIKKEVT
jgi:membrane protein DedA with SNARE-associated domain